MELQSDDLYLMFPHDGNCIINIVILIKYFQCKSYTYAV